MMTRQAYELWRTYVRSFQDIVQRPAWPTRNNIPPDLVHHPVVNRECAPIRTVFGFEPFEVVHLVPLVGNGLPWVNRLFVNCQLRLIFYASRRRNIAPPT